MMDAVKLVCLEPSAPPRLEVQRATVLSPKRGDVVVRVEACSVNPFDVKRATGYGKRLLSLKGAGRFPLVLGNDLAGTVECVGRGVKNMRPGDKVFGLVPAGKGGSHASLVAVDARWLRPAVPGMSATELSVFPYNFTTLWQALHGACLAPNTAKGKRVLVHGASGGLGQLALQLLRQWGASVTAICSTGNVDICHALGATMVWDRIRLGLNALPAEYDAGLNFGAWEDEKVLLSRLKRGAIGYATVVNPLLANVDRYGWFSGAWRSRAEFKGMQAQTALSGASYRWVWFSPQGEALDELHRRLSQGGLALPVGVLRQFSEAQSAFEHVAKQARGRAVLLP